MSDKLTIHQDIVAQLSRLCVKAAILANDLGTLAREERDAASSWESTTALTIADLTHALQSHHLSRRLARQPHQLRYLPGHQPGPARRHSHHRRTPPSTWQQEGGAA